MTNALFPDAPSWMVKPLTEEFKAKAPPWYQKALATMNQPVSVTPEEEARVDEKRELVTNKATGDFEDNYLAFVRSKESPNHGYNDYFGRGSSRSAAAPPKELSTMTLGEVMAWQDATTGQAESNAAGAYQFIRKTLRGLKEEAGLTGEEMFDSDLQDALAVRLMRRRGLDKYQSGEISHSTFANNLAKEWASLPVLTGTERNGVPILPGQSYYKGVGSNKALVKPSELKSYEELFSLADVEPTNIEG